MLLLSTAFVVSKLCLGTSSGVILQIMSAVHRSAASNFQSFANMSKTGIIALLKWTRRKVSF